tara:strand:- start:328 stop:585 length:258 start_codon:yes stop_codon:yes gene_type:complete
MTKQREETKTTTDFKHKAEWYEVTMIQEFTRTVNILAIDEEEAAEIAESRARLSKSIARLGYSLGDVEVIDAKELNYRHGNKKDF